jgi:drug/metabolite transporter (DMT)-like permease
VGAAAIFARYALSGAGPLAVAAGRLGIAAALLLAFALARPIAMPRAQLGRLTLAGVALGLHFAAWIASLDLTTVAVSTLLVATTPLWNALYEAAVLRRRFPARVWLALGTGLVALVAIVLEQGAPATHAANPIAGAALALLGALAFAAYLVLVRGARAESGTRGIVTVTYAVAAIALAVAALASRQPLPALADGPAWGGILAMALVSQLLGHTGMNAALRWFSPTAVAVSTLVEPVIAALLAWALFAERVTAGAGIAAVVLLLAVGVIIWSDPNPKLDRSTSKG